MKKQIQIDTDIIKIIALHPKLQRSALRIYLLMLTIDKPIYQKELTSIAEEVWDEESEFFEEYRKDGEDLDFVRDFRPDVICRAIKTLMSYNLVKLVKKEGNNKFIEVEKDINKIFKK